jgi:tRNA threonylcarbamoyladenosine biosynthesis protein TsaB
VATLTSLANQVENEGTIIPMMDARRMEVYTAVFDKDKNQIEDTSAKILDAESYKEYLDEQVVYFIGSGVEKFKKICEHPNARYIEDKLPSSAQMVSLATIKHKISDFEDVAYFEPYYLKDFMMG